MNTNFNEYIIKFIKCIDISLIGIYYLFFGIIITIIFNKLFGNINYKNMSIMILILNIFLHTSFLMISVYIIRNIIYNIPFPLHGYCNYDHNKIKELNGNILVAFSIISFQKIYFEEIYFLFNNHLNLINI